MDLTAIRDKYQKNLEKDATYKSFQKPKLRLIGDKKTFWESAVQKVINMQGGLSITFGEIYLQKRH